MVHGSNVGVAGELRHCDCADREIAQIRRRVPGTRLKAKVWRGVKIRKDLGRREHVWYAYKSENNAEEDDKV